MIKQSSVAFNHLIPVQRFITKPNFNISAPNSNSCSYFHFFAENKSLSMANKNLQYRSNIERLQRELKQLNL